MGKKTEIMYNGDKRTVKCSTMNRNRFLYGFWINKKIAPGIPLVALAIFCLMGGGRVESAERVTIGLVEDVILLPWGVRIPARIDTGAATSSLDARGLTIKENMAEFKLPAKYGGMQLHLPIVNWKTIRSAEARDRRPIVEIELCVGPKRLHARVNLNDRSQVKYPIILGRDVLRRNFYVDCMKSHCAPPTCPEAKPK
jgi:hypothetical protein